MYEKQGFGFDHHVKQIQGLAVKKSPYTTSQVVYFELGVMGLKHQVEAQTSKKINYFLWQD